MAGIQFALNAVLNDQKEIVESLAGDPGTILQRGIPFSRKICQVTIGHKYDIVIASPGGHPKDINLYQSQKALTHASILTKDGGTAILVAACPEGSGSKAYEDFMQGVPTIEDVFSKFAATEFTIGPHKAFQFARELRRINVILVSDLGPDLVRKLLLTPARDLDAALSIGLKNAPINPQVACLPFATSTIPFIRE
jgi:lactate racemase